MKFLTLVGLSHRVNKHDKSCEKKIKQINMVLIIEATPSGNIDKFNL